MRIMLVAAVTLVAGSVWAGPREFGLAYESVKSGRERTAQADGLMLQSRNGAVRVVDAGRPAPPQPTGQPPDDASLTSAVKGMFRTDVDVNPRQVRVETEDGVVKLSGTVNSPRAAEAAIRLALDTTGVAAVDSSLDWRHGK
jgi:osmotically-inducible protein OsmY